MDYMATHPDAKNRYWGSDMILNVHSDASYLSAPKGRSRAGGIFFLGSLPQDGDPIKLNGAILALATILKCVAASAAEAELGAIIFECTGGEDPSPDSRRIGPPATADSDSHRQLDGGRHRQQHNQTTALSCNGNEIFLAARPRSTINLQVPPPPRTGKFGGFPHQKP